MFCTICVWNTNASYPKQLLNAFDELNAFTFKQFLPHMTLYIMQYRPSALHIHSSVCCVPLAGNTTPLGVLRLYARVYSSRRQTTKWDRKSDRKSLKFTSMSLLSDVLHTRGKCSRYIRRLLTSRSPSLRKLGRIPTWKVETFWCRGAILAADVLPDATDDSYG